MLSKDQYKSQKTDREIFGSLFLKRINADIQRLQQEIYIKKRQTLIWLFLIKILNTFDTGTLRRFLLI